MNKKTILKKGLLCVFAFLVCVCAFAQAGVETGQLPYQNDYCFGLDSLCERSGGERQRVLRFGWNSEVSVGDFPLTWI